MIKADLNRLMSDYSTFTKNLGTRKIVIKIIYINHFLIFKLDLTEINILKFFLANQYKIKDVNSYKLFTRIKLKQNLKAKTI